MMKIMPRILFFALLFLFSTDVVFPHEKSRHPETIPPVNVDQQKLINEEYLQNIKPLFQKSCFDCHSRAAHYPWYYPIPGFKQIIDNDIREALEHLDFSPDFPFRSHESPRADLEAIGEDIRENEMPPFGYRLLHRKQILSPDEKNLILQWVEKSLEMLK